MPQRPSFEQTYGLSRAWATALNVFGTLVVLVFAALLSVLETHRAAFIILTKEHGPVELLTFASFLGASVVSGRLAWQARRHDEARLVVLAYAGFCVLCFLAAMEEISWGQALINYRTPSLFRNVNEQGELNLHNLPGVMELNSAFLLAFGLAGLIGTRLGSTQRLRKLGVAPALWPLFAVIAVMGALAVVVDLVLIQYTFDLIVGALTEAVEMLGGIASLAVVFLNARMLRREWAAAPAPPS